MFLERNQPPPHTVATVVFYHLKWGIRPTQSEGTAALLAGHMTQAAPPRAAPIEALSSIDL